jgi:hypothetical protein
MTMDTVEFVNKVAEYVRNIGDRIRNLTGSDGSCM